MTGAIVFLDPKGTILEVVRSAKNRGYHIVALLSDRSLLDDASEAYISVVKLIDEIIPVDGWTNAAAITNICDKIHSENQIVGIYAGLDPCAVVLALLREKFGLPTSCADDLAIILNKYELRKKLRSLGLSKIKSYHSDEVMGLKSWPFKGAAYFKPVHGFFSAYVRRCENMEDLSIAQKSWQDGGSDEPSYVRSYLRTSKEYHLEEAFDGELLSVETLASSGQIQVLGLTSRILYSKDPVVEMGSCFPYQHPASDKIIDLVIKAHQALGLSEGPAHTEVIVDQNGDIEIIDLNPRFVGADVLQSINHAYEIKIQESLLDYALGNPSEVETTQKNISCIQYFLPPTVPVLEQVSFPKTPEIKFTATFIKLGSRVADTKRQIDYLGCYLIVMPSFDLALSRSRALRSEIKINGEYIGEY